MAVQSIEELSNLLMASINAQSVVLAAVLRPLLANETITEAELEASLDATERAATESRRASAGAVVGLVALLRRDLGWIPEVDPAGAPPQPS